MASELFAPSNLLENCLGLQELIAHVPPDEADSAGAHAKGMIEPDQLHYHGARKLELHTTAAYGLPDGLTLESQAFPVVRYGELRLKGELAQVSYMRLNSIRCLAWMMVDNVIREDLGEMQMTTVESPEDHELEQAVNEAFNTPDRRMSRPLYIPVGMIESVFAAN